MSSPKTTSRSELVRQRRSQPNRQVKLPESKSNPCSTTQTKPVKSNVWQPAHRPNTQPVRHQTVPVSRVANGTRSIPQTAVSSRKVQYKVASNGVETRMLTLPTFHFNWQWVSGILSVVFLSVALLLTNLTIFQVNSISIDGLKRLTPEDLAPVIQKHVGSIFMVNRNDLVESLSFAFPELTIQSLRTALPSSLKITVTERQPILSWTSGDSTLWVDSEGVVFPPRGDSGSILYIYSNDSIPLTRSTPIPTDPLDYLNIALDRAEKKLSPEEALKHMDPAIIKAAIDFSTQMPEGSALVYDSVSGMGWKDSRGWTVFFGSSLENMAFKQTEYQSIVERLAALGITPTTISVEYADAPYYRTE
jgi:hypothetical protein